VNEPIDSGPARLRCHPLGSLDVNGMKSLLSVFDVKANRIYHAAGAGQRIRDGALVVNVGPYGLKLRIIRTKQSVPPVRMPRRDPNGKSARAQMPNDAAADKAGSAEHGDGATVRCHHGSNFPIHVGASHC
jgi:hypothetical protein